MREKWKAHFASTCIPTRTYICEIWFLARDGDCAKNIRACCSFHREDARQNGNYLSTRCIPREKWPEEDDVCVRAVYAHYVAISIVQHVPRGMENECFQAGAVCSCRCVRAWATRVSCEIIRMRAERVYSQDYIVRCWRRRRLASHNCILVSRWR